VGAQVLPTHIKDQVVTNVGICQPQENTHNHQTWVNGRNHQLQGGGTISITHIIQKITKTSSIVAVQN
jgi:hypothetical protein